MLAPIAGVAVYILVYISYIIDCVTIAGGTLWSTCDRSRLPLVQRLNIQLVANIKYWQILARCWPKFNIGAILTQIKYWPQFAVEKQPGNWTFLPNSDCIQFGPVCGQCWPLLTTFEEGSMAECTVTILTEIRSDERYMFIAKKIQIGWSDHSTDISGRTNSYHRLVSRVWSDFDWNLGQEGAQAIVGESTWSEWDEG